jgi:hypothetical protein
MDAIEYTPRLDHTQDLYATALGLGISEEMRARADEGSRCPSRITRHGTAASILYRHPCDDSAMVRQRRMVRSQLPATGEYHGRYSSHGCWCGCRCSCRDWKYVSKGGTTGVVYARWHHTKRRASLRWRSTDRTLQYMSSVVWVVCLLMILKLP